MLGVCSVPHLLMKSTGAPCLLPSIPHPADGYSQDNATRTFGPRCKLRAANLTAFMDFEGGKNLCKCHFSFCYTSSLVF